jgi:hypothetical protein
MGLGTSVTKKTNDREFHPKKSSFVGFLPAFQEHHQEQDRSNAILFQELGFDQLDGAGFLGAHRLRIDAQLRPDFFGRLSVDENQFKNLAATVRQVFDLLVDFLEQFHPEHFPLKGRFRFLLLAFNVGDLEMRLPVLAGSDREIDTGVADHPVQKTLEIIHGFEIRATGPGFGESFGDNVFGRLKLTGNALGVQT